MPCTLYFQKSLHSQAISTNSFVFSTILQLVTIPHNYLLFISWQTPKKRKIAPAEETPPTSLKEKERHWLRRAVSPLNHKATKQKVLMGIWRVSGSSWPQNLAVGSGIAFNSTPSGNKLVGIHNRMGMEYTSKFNGTLVVKSQLFKLVKVMLNVTGPTNTQEDDLHGAVMPPPTAVQASCLHSILFRPSVHVAGRRRKRRRGIGEFGMGLISIASGQLDVYRIGRSMFETESLPSGLARYTQLLDEPPQKWRKRTTRHPVDQTPVFSFECLVYSLPNSQVWVPTSYSVASFQKGGVDPLKLFTLPQMLHRTTPSRSQGSGSTKLMRGNKNEVKTTVRCLHLCAPILCRLITFILG
eukprot:1137083-Pelagomonas_calceolata.AAC.1